MTGSKLTKTILLATALFAAAAGCNVREPHPFDPRVYQVAQRERAREVKPQTLPPMPTELRTPFADAPMTTQPATRSTTLPIGEALPTTVPSVAARDTVRLPLREIVQRSTINNTEVRVAAYDPAIEETRVVEEEAEFDPSFISSAFYEQRDDPTGGTVSSFLGPTVFREEAEVITGAVGVRQRLQTGGTAEARYEISRNDLDPARTEINPYYENDLILEITQPLMRNLGVAVNRARINITRNNQRISLYDFRESVEENAFETEEAYWELYAAMEDVRILRELLDDTMRTGIVLYRRFVGGFDVSRLQTAQAAASYQERRAALIRAEARVRDISDELKRRMNDPSLPVTSAGVIVPTDAPLLKPISFDLADQIDTALENRLELSQQWLRVESATIASNVAHNGLYPELNLITALSVKGIGEDVGDSAEAQSDFNRLGYRLGLELEIPIGNRGPRALYRRSLLQRQQAITQYQNLVEQISQEVTAAVRDVDTTWREITATRETFDAARDALRVIQQREENQEPLIPTFVQLKLDTQELTAQAARAYTSSIANYNIALSRLERAKGTVLRYNNIVLEEVPAPFDAQNP